MSEQPVQEPPFWYRTPLWGGRLRIPEEIPLFLAFFHLGSVIRYKPRFMEQVMDSAYYPFILAAKRHCTTKIYLLTLNGLSQTTHIARVV